MKKSEYVKSREEYWRQKEGGVRAGWTAAAQQDCEAAEAAGVEWDPEEPELPARVGLYEHPKGRVIFDEGGTEYWLLQEFETQPGRGCIEHRFAKAVVALWNAWGPDGDLRRRLSEWATCEGVYDLANPNRATIRREFARDLLTEVWKGEG